MNTIHEKIGDPVRDKIKRIEALIIKRYNILGSKVRNNDRSAIMIGREIERYAIRNGITDDKKAAQGWVKKFLHINKLNSIKKQYHYAVIKNVSIAAIVSSAIIIATTIYVRYKKNKAKQKYEMLSEALSKEVKKGAKVGAIAGGSVGAIKAIPPAVWALQSVHEELTPYSSKFGTYTLMDKIKLFIKLGLKPVVKLAAIGGAAGLIIGVLAGWVYKKCKQHGANEQQAQQAKQQFAQQAKAKLKK